jgi:hypothetical protein
MTSAALYHAISSVSSRCGAVPRAYTAWINALLRATGNRCAVPLASPRFIAKSYH